MPLSDGLFPYQEVGAEFLAGKKLALLADEMGLGKSAQVVRACDQIGAERILVLCPAVARVNWVREFEKFSTKARTFSVMFKKTHQIETSESVVCSYDLAPYLTSVWSWDVLVLDECHFLKSLDTLRTRTVYGRDGLARKAKRIWCLSGTPSPNHPGELWPMLYTFGALKDKPFAKYDDFVEKFCVLSELRTGNTIRKRITGARVQNIPELKSILNPVMLRRRKEEVMSDLPPINYTHIVVAPGEVDIEVEPSFVQYTFPVDRREELKEKLEAEQKLVNDMDRQSSAASLNGLAALASIADSVSTLRRYIGLQKVEAVVKMVDDELKSGAYNKIVIFAIHQAVIEGVRSGLAHYKPVTLYGGTPADKRSRNVDKFMKNDTCRVFIGNIQAAGTAITLTVAHQVLFVEQSWVPGDNAQACMRCHRIGQTKPVSVRFVGLANTLDDKISEVLRRKTREITRIYDEPLEDEKDFSKDFSDFDLKVLQESKQEINIFE